MKKLNFTCALLLVVFIASCNTTKEVVKIDRGNTISTGLKIGLIADSQITTGLNIETGNRSKDSDKFANVALRTPAQEYLALEHLEYMLGDLNKQNVDVILYLGDGANSGCKSEVDDFFSALSKARKKFKTVPIFFVIGNHDYLATGNDDSLAVRKEMCVEKKNLHKVGSEKAFYSKEQVVALTVAFNKESYNKYNNKKIFNEYVDNFSDESTVSCSGDEQEQHLNACYYAAVLKYKAKGVSGELLLVDTSDYSNMSLLPNTCLIPTVCGNKPSTKSFYGVRGAISWQENSQITWIKDQLKDSNENNIRIIASHYPSTDLYWPGGGAGKTGDLLKQQDEQNIWLSAHTHTANLNMVPHWRKYTEANIKVSRVSEYNIGSTTDFFPHVGVLQDINSRSNIYPIPTINNLSACYFMNEKYFDFGKGKFEVYKGVEGDMALGITSYYRNEKWSFDDTVATRKNIDKFLEQMTSSEREQAVRCMITKASLVEYGMKGIIN